MMFSTLLGTLRLEQPWIEHRAPADIFVVVLLLDKLKPFLVFPGQTMISKE